MAIPGGLTPFEDFVSVSYQLISYNTLQPITHSGNYVEVNNSQFIFLKVHSLLTGFDKRVNKILLTFKQYTNLNYQVYLNVSNAGHFISNSQIPLRKYTSNNLVCYEADITDIVVSSPTEEHYFAITTSSSMSFFVNGTNKPDASIVSYSVKTGNYSPYFFDRLKSYQLRSYSLDVDLFSLVPFHVFNLFDYCDELVSFNLSLVNDFIHKDTSNITQTIGTGFPKGFKLNIQQYIYSSGTREFTYIDENYFSHVFKKCTNDNDTFTHFVDSNGSYLILEIINNGYKIYSLDGNVKTFSSSGLLINETIKNGSNTSTISYSYTNNLLTSVSINNQIFISITYSTSSITISLPSNSSITLNFNSGSLLTSIVDQENITYQIEYDSNVAGLIESVSVTNNKKLSLSFNDNLMIEAVSLYTYDSSTSNYVWNLDYDFSSGSYTTSYFDDDDLVYVYHFNEEGQIIQTTCYKSNFNNVLSVSCLKETIGHSFFLSTSSANYLKEITYNSNTYSHFDSSISLFNNNQQASFILKPKEKGQYFLYFEYLRNFINNYQSLNTLSIQINVSHNGNTFTILPTTALSITGFDKTNVFLKEIVVPEEYYEEKLNVTFYLSSGEGTVTIRNIRLYRIEESNNEYYGLNSYTGGNDLNLLTDETTPPHYYELTSSIPFDVDNLTYSVNSYYQDIKATFMAHFFLNKGLLFYNKGKNAYFGSITKSGQSLDDLVLVKANYQNKRLSTDDEPYDGYNATINGYVLLYNNLYYFVESQVSYNYQFKTYSSSGKLVDQNYLLVNQISNVPYGETNESDPENGNYKYHTYIQTLSFTYNSYGQLIKKNLSTNASNHSEIYFTKCSEVNSYSSDYKHLTSVNQQLFNNNNQVNNIVSSYQYSSLGDVSKMTDAYNKETSYSYNKFHSLTSLVSYNSGTYHNNNISYSALLNASSISNFNNQNQTTYSYDYKGRVSHISHDSITLDFDYQNNSNSIEYSDGNDSYSFTNTYSDYHLPINFKHDNNIILEYHYINKNSGLPGNGNPSTDQLSEIRDYKGQTGNNYNSRTYSYNDYGNISSISENGIVMTTYTTLFTFEDDPDCDLNDNAIKNVVVFSRDNNAFRLENSYSFFQDPFLKHKTIRENATQYVVGITESISTMVSGSPQLTLSTYINDLINHQIYTSFNYFKDENDKLTSFVKEQNVYLGNTFKTINYGYNNNGNLNSILSSDFGQNNSYSYNDFNELSSENSTGFGQINYQYDSKGNIKVISKLNSSEVYTLDYDNNNRLISFTKTVGLNTPETFSCNNYSFGRPNLYKNKSLAWDKNELIQYDGVAFAYDGYGRRTSKSSISLGRSVSYLYLGDTLLEEVITINNVDYTLKYLHDSRSNIVGFIYNNNVYFYVKDLLNNVIAIYNQSNTLICKYIYDAYGNHKVLNPNGTEHDTTDETFVGYLNPIRYRSYYYDKETGLYYLKSRYYDPEICRFISMDDISYLDPQTLNGLNLYAYCLNNPIMYRDENGTSFTLIAFLASIIVCALVGATVNVISAVANGATAQEVAIMGLIGFGLGALFGAALGASGAMVGTSVWATIGAYSIGVVAGATNEVLNTVALSNVVEHRSPTADEIVLSIVLGALSGLASVGLGQLLGAGLSPSELYDFQNSISAQLAYNFLFSRPISFLNMAIELSFSSQKRKQEADKKNLFIMRRLIRWK